MRAIVLSIACVGCSASAPSLGGERVVAVGPASDGRIGLGALDRALSLEVQRSYRAELANVEPPLALVPSDGSELALKVLDAKVVVTGPLARTELSLTFHNAEPRIREGRFAIALPPGATVGKLAMKINGVWRESRVVSRARGREVYETFLHQRVDPALLERDLGNQFSARIFPIGPREDKEIIIAYEHLVSASAPYRLGLTGLPAVPACRVAIDHDGTTRKLDVSGRAPADVKVAIAPGQDAVAGDGAFVARVDVPATGQPASLDSTLFLVDTSASRAAVMANQTELLRALFAALPDRTPVAVATFDHRFSELYRGPAGRAHEALPAILDHGALGGSDLGGALTRAGAAGLRRVVVIGDGAPTLGETEPAQLAKIIERSPIERVDVIQVGESLDRDTLGQVVASGAVPGALLTSRDPARLAIQLATQLAPPSSIRVAGAKSWPETTAGVAPGDQIDVFGLRDKPGSLAVTLSGREITVVPRAGDPAQIRRVVAGAELAELTAQLQLATAEARPALAAQIEKLALAHELVSPMTSLIVLETDADEHRMLGTRHDPPTIDQGSTKQGIVIEDRDSLQNLPIARAFASVVVPVSGSQNDLYGESAGEAIIILHAGLWRTGANVVASKSGRLAIVPGETGVSSSLAQHQIAEAIKTNAFALADHAARRPAPEPPPPAAHTGKFHDVMVALRAGQRDRALVLATRWQLANPGEVAAILALGEALEARGADALAARAYGSLVDLYPNRVELVRLAGERFERLALRTPPACASSRSTAIAAHCASVPITRRLIACSRSRCSATIAPTRRSM
ncbi:MAG: VIT domain-containing protein [Kofleriaceae bacterium]